MKLPNTPAIQKLKSEVVEVCKAVVTDREQLRGDYVDLALSTLVKH